ncbi:MAG: AMP-binding protein [Halioglobus sp.]|nr:AMP-binding protein [Halioglobus sp.]
MSHGVLTSQQKRLAQLQADGVLPLFASLSFSINRDCCESDVRNALLNAIYDLEALRTRFKSVRGLKAPVPEVLDVHDHSILEWTKLPFQQDDWQRGKYAWTVYAQWQDSAGESAGDHWLSLHLDAKSIDVRSAEILCEVMDRRLQGKRSETEWCDYSLVAEWQQSLLEDKDAANERQEAERFWQQRLRELRPLVFPVPRFRVDRNERPLTRNRHQFGLSSDLMECMDGLVADRPELSVAVLLQSAWAVCVASSEALESLPLPAYQCERSVDELQDCFGLLDIYQPKQAVIEPSYNWFELAAALKSSDEQGLLHSEFYLPGVSCVDVAESGLPVSPETNLACAAAFRCIDWTDSSGELLGVSEIEHESDCHSLDLSVQRAVTGQTICTLSADDRTLGKEDVVQLANRWQQLLVRWAKMPSETVSALAVGDPPGQPVLEGEQRVETDTGLFDAIARQALENPQAPAFRFKSQCLDYSALCSLCARVADALSEVSAPGDRVGVLMERRLELLPCLLGVMWSGRVFVPLDPVWPQSRIAQVIADSGCACVVVDPANEAKVLFPDCSVIALSCVLNSEKHACDTDQNTLLEAPDADDPAYIMYTSGTTGIPRGVCVSHAALSNYTAAITNVLSPVIGGHFGWISTYAADLGYTAVFPALAKGCCIHLIEASNAIDVQSLNEYCRRFPLDVLKIVPSHCLALLQAAADAGSAPDFLPRDSLVLGGEAPNQALLEALFAADNPPARVLNHYGPTETTIGVMWAELRPDQPHGLANVLANNKIYILNDEGGAVPPGVRGELAIVGKNLSSGYWDNASSNRDRFIELRCLEGDTLRTYLTGDYAVQSGDGRVHILGRRDDQMKVRGYRVEPAEVERVLTGLPDVSEAVVASHPAHPDQLVGYVVPRRGVSLAAADLRLELSGRLPEYMVPGRLISLEQLPLTRNGKVDKSRLPDPDTVLSRSYEAPSTDAERLMVSIWEQTLDVDRVGIADNFFDIGGHSLLGIKLLSQVRTQFRVEVGPGAMTEAATPSELVHYITSIESQPGVIEKIASARLRLASMSEAERKALESRSVSKRRSSDGDLSPAA